jgi:fructose-bisphosphate aldolase class II
VTRATLSDVLTPALRDGYAVAGMVCLGWEDARAFVRAAEAEGAPVILQAGPGCRAHTPLEVLGPMLGYLADRATVPVVLHLDHGYSAEECRDGIAAGFTSVMFDGSRLPLAENIAATRAIVEMAHASGVSCEGEIGFVGYADGAPSTGTDPAEAAKFAAETGVDAMAVSVGNVHLQTEAAAGIDMDLVRSIEAGTAAPLVLHGGSGIPAETRRVLAETTNVAKFNIGTEVRMAFGTALRASLAEHPEDFDRIEILRRTEAPVAAATRLILRNLGGSGRYG